VGLDVVLVHGVAAGVESWRRIGFLRRARLYVSHFETRPSYARGERNIAVPLKAVAAGFGRALDSTREFRLSLATSR
jgi:hypothetical protein